MGPKIASFTDAWVRHVATDRTAFVFLGDAEVEQERVRFGELYRRVSVAAAALSERVAAGERAILLYPSGIDFIVAFLACLAAGVIPVPVSTPHPRAGLDALRAIATDSGATLLLSAGSLLGKFREKIAADAALGQLGVVDTAGWAFDTASDALLRRPNPGDLALLQYTSGSTGNPRGVAVTHANLIANHRQIEQGFGNGEGTVIGSWLPMFHDMGLGAVLHGLWLGVPCILMSPAAFLQKPVRWLRAISRYRVTTSGGPDFAYDLCTRRISQDEKRSLDLASWETAYSGSEPIRAGVVERFMREFAECGLRPGAFHPVYGLAEATLMVTAKPVLEPNRVLRFSRDGLAQGKGIRDDSARSAALVACGTTWLDGQLRIVNPSTLEASAPGQIGEIWVGGPNVAAGYWGKADETRATFQAHTSDGEGPFLRTGDLGLLHEGRLFITGRCKDLIIVRGKNHYPQDIEASVSSCHVALEPQRAAAVALRASTPEALGESAEAERLLIVQEVRRTALGSLDPEAVFSTIRATVAREHGVAVHAVVLIHPATLLRTSSGKVRRQACLDAYLDGSLLVIAQSVLCAPEAIDDLAPNGVLASSHPTAFGSLPAAIAPHGPDSTRVVSALELEQGAALRRRVEAHVFDWVARHRKVPVSQLDPRASISDWGVDSLARVDLVRSLEKLLGVSVSESDLHAVDSIDDLAQLMARLCLPDRDATSARILSEPASGEAAEQAPRTAASGTPRHIELPRFTPIKWD